MHIVDGGVAEPVPQFAAVRRSDPAQWNPSHSPERVRRLFEEAIRLADGGEAAHARADLWPHGLADHLIVMLDDLEDHELRQDAALSLGLAPIAGSCPDGADRLAGQLAALSTLAHGFRAPPFADGGWRRLYRLCRALDRLLCERLALDAKRAN